MHKIEFPVRILTVKTAVSLHGSFSVRADFHNSETVRVSPAILCGMCFQRLHNKPLTGIGFFYFRPEHFGSFLLFPLE
jgi:hypothetical protein